MVLKLRNIENFYYLLGLSQKDEGMKCKIINILISIYYFILF